MPGVLMIVRPSTNPKKMNVWSIIVYTYTEEEHVLCY
ncbi:hypothetical protein V7199_28135 [Priestia megaterium]|uniref:Uncharacterized protein n=1 Tax=Priestia megaterium TaxID=1404 RepID=A0ABD4WLY4_PRIMG|nr:hypothetical protein [Priestia megaterium]MDD9781242.1 hypothetical protein [Priestia megaterium]